MSTKRFGLLTLALAITLAPAASFAGGPLLVFDPGTETPYAWNPAAPVAVYTDIGPFGPATNADADAAVQFALSEWSGVPTSALSLVNVGDVGLIGLGDIATAADAANVVGVDNGGGIHVIYDDTGNIGLNFFGAPPGVLGIASPDFANGAEITESWVYLNGTTVDATDGNLDDWVGVITHEFGHSINLAHTETNGAVGFFGDFDTPGGCPSPYTGPGLLLDDLETMYPFIDPTDGTGTGPAQATIEHPDDVTALSDLYAAGGYPGTFGTISGTVFDSDGVTPVTGVNVIIRNVADPFADSNSQLSGNRTQGDLGPDGRFEFNGLTPGAEYVLYIDTIDAGGFSTTPTGVNIEEEFWNSNESADPSIDDVCVATPITVAANQTVTADFVLQDPGPVLPLGDDDFVEVAIGFDFPFCDGNSYGTVFVNSNGSVTFGAGDTDFSESVSDFLGGPPRIAMLWDDLSPNEGGSVTAENVGGEFVVTFTNVPQFFTGDQNSFSLTLRPDGTYAIEHGAINSQDAIVGRTQGVGAVDPGSVDLSGLSQPIGFGEQTIYQLFSFEPIDLANGTTEWTICEDLPPAILDVDTTPISVTLAPGANTTLQLEVGNAAVPPARDLEWSSNAISLRVGPSAYGLTTELFEPETAFRLERPVKRSGSAAKRADAGARLEDVARSMPEPGLARALGPNVVDDGSFELGPFGGAWVESSTNFGTPICDVVSCGTGTGTGPRTGTFWTWFGGISAFEAGSVSQTVVIPTGQVTMSFWIEQIVCDSPSDYMSVRIDGTEVFRTDGGSAICGQLGYTEVTLDLTALGFADGAAHNVEFFSEIFAANGGGTNFFLDDVVIATEIESCGFLTVAPTSGVVPAGDSQFVDLTFDATGLTTGTYDCELSITSNGGDATIPVTLNVSGGDVPPVAECNPWVTVVNETDTGPCEADVLPALVDNGSFDPDGGDVTLALDPPGPYVGGQNPVTLIVTDDEGNVATCEAVIVVDCPVPVSFTDVSVAREGWGAVLQWRLAGASGFQGFHVYRRSGDAPRVRITDQLVGLSETGTIQFVDELAPVGAATYTVELLRDAGTTVAFGPFALSEGSGDGSLVRLEAGSPNPFQGQTSIAYALRSSQPVNLSVFDVRGRLVATLVEGVKDAGRYTVTWDGRGDSGSPLGAGVYLMRLQAQDEVQVQKVMLTR